MQKFGNWLKRQFDTAAAAVVSLPPPPSPSTNSRSSPPVNRRNAVDSAHQYSESLVRFFCILVTVFVGMVNLLVSPRISFIPLYLLLVAISAWRSNRRTGVWVSLISLAATVADGLLHHAEWKILGWTVGLQWIVSLILAFFISAIRTSTLDTAQRAREKTTALDREMSDRQQTEDQLRKTMQQLRQLADNIVDVFWMREAGDDRVVYVSPAYETIWGRTSKDLYQSADVWLDSVHGEDRRAFLDARFSLESAGRYQLQYRIVRPDGSLRWIRDRAYPIRNASGKIIRIVGIAEDVTDHRRLEREILEISDREQARMGQDLHDGLCQQLVSLGFDSHSLEQRLADRQLEESIMAQKMGRMIDDAITEARALSRGLFPVQLQVEGLGLALSQLAENVTARTEIQCQFRNPRRVLVRDNTVATHLYRIAQEAVNNAVKHSRAKSIVIQLRSENHRLELTVTDDGEGFAAPSRGSGGMGMYIMNYRAAAIGGVVAVRAAGERGTVVVCSAPEPNA